MENQTLPPASGAVAPSTETHSSKVRSPLGSQQHQSHDDLVDSVCAALIQLMAAAKANRGLAFFTFGDEKVKHDVEEMYNLLCAEDATVGE